MYVCGIVITNHFPDQSIKYVFLVYNREQCILKACIDKWKANIDRNLVSTTHEQSYLNNNNDKNNNNNNNNIIKFIAIMTHFSKRSSHLSSQTLITPSSWSNIALFTSSGKPYKLDSVIEISEK